MSCPRAFYEFMAQLRDAVEFHQMLGKRWKIKASLDPTLPQDS